MVAEQVALQLYVPELVAPQLFPPEVQAPPLVYPATVHLPLLQLPLAHWQLLEQVAQLPNVPVGGWGQVQVLAQSCPPVPLSQDWLI